MGWVAGDLRWGGHGDGLSGDEESDPPELSNDSWMIEVWITGVCGWCYGLTWCDSNSDGFNCSIGCQLGWELHDPLVGIYCHRKNISQLRNRPRRAPVCLVVSIELYNGHLWIPSTYGQHLTVHTRGQRKLEVFIQSSLQLLIRTVLSLISSHNRFPPNFFFLFLICI